MNDVKRFYVERERPILGFLFACFLLLLWESFTRLGIINPFMASSPTRIGASVIEQASDGSLLNNFIYTMVEVFAAFGLAAVVGLALGAFMSWYRIVKDAISPFMWLLLACPVMALYPLLLIWLGLGFKIAVAIGFAFAFVYITANTLEGINGVDAVLIKAARSFGASKRVVFFRVMMPAALPMLIAGLRLGFGRALIGVIVAEMFSANQGLGYVISYYGTKLQLADCFAGLLVVVVIGISADQILRNVELRFSRWRISA